MEQKSCKQLILLKNTTKKHQKNARFLCVFVPIFVPSKNVEQNNRIF